MMEYRVLQEQEIERGLFRTFIRHQVVDQCLRRENGIWVVRPDLFIDDWTEDDYRILIAYVIRCTQAESFMVPSYTVNGRDLYR